MEEDASKLESLTITPKTTSPYPEARLVKKDGSLSSKYYVSLSADVLFVRSPFGNKSETIHPENLMDFYKWDKKIELTRMNDDEFQENRDLSLQDLLKDIVSEEDGYNGCALRLYGKFYDKKREIGIGHKKHITVIAETPEECQNWILALRFRLAPWSKLTVDMKSFREELKLSRQVDITQVGDISNARVTSEKVAEMADKMCECAGTANKIASWGLSVASSASHIAYMGEALTKVTKTLSIVSFIGPAFQVMGLLASTTSMIANAYINKKRLRMARDGLGNACKELEEVLHVLAETKFSDEILIRKVFEVFETCWDSVIAIERHMIACFMMRVWKSGDYKTIKEEVKSIEAKMFSVGLLKHMSKQFSSHDDRITECEERICAFEGRDYGFIVLYPNDDNSLVLDAAPEVINIKNMILPRDAENTDVENQSDASQPLYDCVRVRGEGGIGKTSTCKLICADKAVQGYFSGGILWMELGNSISERKVVRMIARLVGDCGDRDRARQIESDMNDLEEAIRRAESLLKPHRVLLVLDNVWEMSDYDTNSNWIHLLSGMVNKRNGSCVLSTMRSKSLSRTFDGESVESVELNLLNMVKRESLLNGLVKCADGHDEGKQKLLELSCGLPLVISIYAALIQKNNGNANSVHEKIASRSASLFPRNSPVHLVKAAVTTAMIASLQHLDESMSKEETNPREVGTDGLSYTDENQASMRYGALQVMDKTNPQLSMNILRHLWHFPRWETAHELAKEFEDLGLGAIVDDRLEMNDMSGSIFKLHDLQFEYCANAATGRAKAVTGGVSRADAICEAGYHKLLLSSLSHPRAPFDKDVSWGSICFQKGLIGYMPDNLLRHLSAAMTLPTTTNQPFLPIEEARCVVLSVLFDFRWNCQRIRPWRQFAVVQDFDFILSVEVNGERFLNGDTLRSVSLVRDIWVSIESECFPMQDSSPGFPFGGDFFGMKQGLLCAGYSLLANVLYETIVGSMKVCSSSDVRRYLEIAKQRFIDTIDIAWLKRKGVWWRNVAIPPDSRCINTFTAKDVNGELLGSADSVDCTLRSLRGGEFMAVQEYGRLSVYNLKTSRAVFDSNITDRCTISPLTERTGCEQQALCVFGGIVKTWTFSEWELAKSPNGMLKCNLELIMPDIPKEDRWSEGGLDCASISDDGKRIVASSRLKIYIWDVSEGDFLSGGTSGILNMSSRTKSIPGAWSIPGVPVDHHLTKILISPNGSAIASILRYDQFFSPVLSVLIENENGRYFCSALEFAYRNIDLASDRFSRSTFPMAFSHDGSLLVIGSYEKAIIFKVTRRNGINETKLNELGRISIYRSYVTALAIVEGLHPGILLGLSNGVVQQWDLSGKKCIAVYKPPPRFTVGSAHEENYFHNKGKDMGIAGIVALNTKEVPNETRKTQKGDFAVLHKDRSVVVWETSPGQLNEDQQASSGNPGYVTGSCVAASRNSGIIASGGSHFQRDDFRNEVVIWSSDTGDMIKRLKGHRRRIDCIDISDDGRWVVSGDQGNKFIVWDVEKNKRVVEIVDEKSYRPIWVVFPNDNKDKRIVTASILRCRHFSTLNDSECDSERFEPCCKGEEVRICIWNSRTGHQYCSKMIKVEYGERFLVDMNQLMPFLAVSRDARFVAFCGNCNRETPGQFGMWNVEDNRSFQETKQLIDRNHPEYLCFQIFEFFEQLGTELECNFSKTLIRSRGQNVSCLESPTSDEKYTISSNSTKIRVTCEPKSNTRYGYDQQQIAEATCSISGTSYAVGDISACFIPSEGETATRVAFVCSASGSSGLTSPGIGMDIWEFIPAKCTKSSGE